MAAKETGEDILKHLQKEGSSKVQAQVAAELAKIQGEKPKPKSKKTSTPKMDNFVRLNLPQLLHTQQSNYCGRQLDVIVLINEIALFV